MMRRIDVIGAPQDVHNYFEELKLKLAFRMSTMFLIVFTILTFSYYTDSDESFYTMVLGVLISVTSLIIIKLKKQYKPTYFLYSFGGVFVTGVALTTFHNTIHLVDVLWMLAAVSLGFFGIGRKTGFILLISSLIFIVIFIFHSLNIHIKEVEPRTFYQQFSLVIEMISGFLLNFYLFYLFMDINRFSFRKLQESYDHLWEQNQRIIIQNDEKTTLVREIHHRVKNNLQIVVSLLRMQSQEIDNKEVKELFQESINRIMTMSLIHQKLYQNENLSLIRIEDYLYDLVRELLSLEISEKKIQSSIQSSVDKIGLKTIIPIGLLVNELVSNSLKHAFKNVQNPSFEIEIESKNEGWIQLIYRDNGKWDAKGTEKSSFGLLLIETLVEQLDGQKKVDLSDKGTTYTFVLSNIEEVDILA